MKFAEKRCVSALLGWFGLQCFGYGGEDIYDGWMKNKKTAMISCNDGFRPVSFFLEAIE